MKRMQKRLAALLLCMFFMGVVLPVPARADMGPKPSVQLTFENMGGETCWCTLLSLTASTGPWSAWDGREAHIYNYDVDLDIWRAFVEYEDPDGYYFLQTAARCSDTGQYAWTYYPPSSFKILLYYPETDTFVTSGVYERYAFDSYYTVDLAGVEPGAGTQPLLTARKSYDYTWEGISLVCRIVLTILLELGVALLFGFGQRALLVPIAGVNLATQGLLNLALNVVCYQAGGMAFFLGYILLELVVFAIEAGVYGRLLPRRSGGQASRRKAVVYALTANAASFAAGWWLALHIPGVF